MKTTLIYILFAGLIVGSSHSLAQDVHFSQMQFSPMLLNPGLSGANSPLTAIANYRSQWRSVASPYTTINASVDGRFNERKRMKKGIIAGGLNFFNDQVGDLKVSTNSVNLNLAYHLIIDREQTIGLGIYGGFTQRAITNTNGRWGSQYNGTSYDPLMTSGEDFATPNFSFLDAGAGLVYTYKTGEGYMTQNNHRLVNAGVACYHVNQPSYSFINKPEERLPLRWSAFATAIIGFSNSNGALAPAIYFNRQKTNTEILYGTYYRISVGENSHVTARRKATYISLGLFHRWKDALVAKAMLEYGPVSGGFAYDINISTLTEVSSARGGFEVFLKYSLATYIGGGRAMIR
jgi:type IX secretion system PorP/SprF family membrane protein